MTTYRLAALALATTLPLAAATAQARADDPDTIVVTAQRAARTEVVQGGQIGVLGDRDGLDVPFNVRSYGASLILNQQSETLGEVLENDPSVRVSRGFGNSAELFIVRGFPLYGDDIAIDGLYGVTPRQLVSPELYDQVQVLNGASAFLNGAAPGGSGIGGGVNLLFKRAGTRPLARVTAGYQQQGLFGGGIDVGRRFTDDRLGARINAMGRSGDSAIDDEYHRTIVVGTGFDWRDGTARVSLDLGYQYNRVDRQRPTVTVAGTGVPRVPGARENYGQRWTYTRLRDFFGVLDAAYDLGENFTLYAKGGARDGAESGDYSTITVTNAVTGAARGSRLYVPRTDNNEAAQVGARATLASGPIRHRIDIGGSALWQVGRFGYAFGTFPVGVRGPNATTFATNLYAPRQVARPVNGTALNIVDPFPRTRTDLESIYLSDTASAFDDRVQVIAGLRRQEIDANVYAYDTGRLATRYKEGATTPVVGVVLRPTRTTSLYFNRIEGLAQGPSAPASAANVGTVFPPYRSVQYEFGGKIERRGLSASLAFYQIAQPNAFTDPRSLVFAVDGEQRDRGVEFNLTAEPARGLRFIGGATAIDAKQRRTAGGLNDGKDAIGVPDYTVNGNVEYDLAFLRGATLTARVTHTGRQKVDQANTLALAKWTTVDLGGRYVVPIADRPVTFRLYVDNVADSRFWESAFGGYLLQGRPRTVRASASVDL